MTDTRAAGSEDCIPDRRRNSGSRWLAQSDRHFRTGNKLNINFRRFSSTGQGWDRGSELQVLRPWRENTAYRSDEDWTFASPHYHGTTPYTYQILFRRHIRPVIERISGIKSSKEAPLGWHTQRRSLATLLISNGENVKVAQSQLRHTTPKIPLELYAQAVSADQHKAHKQVVQLVLPAEFSEKLKARSVTATA